MLLLMLKIQMEKNVKDVGNILKNYSKMKFVIDVKKQSKYLL